jgi:hypothetical protein
VSDADSDAAFAPEPAPASDVAPADAPAGELEPTRAAARARGAIAWKRTAITTLSLDQVPAGGGFYVVFEPRTGQPLHVGRADDLRARWRERLGRLRRRGAADARGTLMRPIHVWFGSFRSMT